MPRSFLNIPGANPYNFCLMFITLNCLVDREKSDVFRLPIPLKFFCLMYFILFFTTFLRMYFDMGTWYELMDRLNAPHPSNPSLIVDYLLDPLKFTVPGLLLLYGTKTADSGRFALFAVIAMGLILAVQVVRVMMPGLMGADDLASRALRVLDRDIGYHRVGISTVLAMITSGVFGLFVVLKKKSERMIALFSFSFLLLALALTGGRAGLAACILTCALMGVFRYRKILIIGPVIGLFLIPVVPGLQERILEGFTEQSEAPSSVGSSAVDVEGKDLYAITSGRAVVWPVVLSYFRKSPWFGYGGESMIRAGVTTELFDVLQAQQHGFSHPHNMYLRVLLDTGVLGTLIVLCFFIYLISNCYRDFVGTNSSLVTEVGAVAFGMMISYLLCGVGSGTFFPETNTVMLWAIMGLYAGIHWSKLGEVRPSYGRAEPLNESKVEIRLWLKTKP